MRYTLRPDLEITKTDLRALEDTILSAPVGTNVVYYTNCLGWWNLPDDIRRLIVGLVNQGLIVTATKRNGSGTFDMVAQRTRRAK